VEGTTAHVLGDRFTARASTAQGEERDRLWKLMTAAWPAYDDYQTKTDRRIPVVVLTKT
jgi:deazaflavin-dependent oxidoreductase (nitroreductase family)